MCKNKCGGLLICDDVFLSYRSELEELGLGWGWG